nr:ribonuclease H-like domain-containing protein [Tanacetum cinerariifolium]
MASSCCSSNVTPTPILDEIIALSDIPKVMKIFFEQQIAEEEAFTKYIRDKIADVKASLTRVRTAIREMESKSDKDAWKDAIDCFKETKDRCDGFGVLCICLCFLRMKLVGNICGRVVCTVDDENATNPSPVPPTPQAPHTISTIKLPILKKDTNGQRRVLPPKTAKEILAREKERKAKTTLLMAIPEDHLAKFYKITDAKEMWEAIKSRFGVSTEDANQKFLRSLPSSWSQVPLIMRTNPGVDTLSTNEVSTTYGVSTSSSHNLQKEGSSSYIDDLMYSFFVNQSSGPQLDHKDLEQVDEFDLEEMDLRWQVAMISTRLNKFYKKTGRKLHFDAKEPVGFDKTKMSAKNKSGLGYGTQIHEGVLSYENEVLEIVFDSRSCDVEDSHVNDRFAKVEGKNAVPPPMTGIYMPPKSDFRIDESKFTYGLKRSKNSESDAKTSDLASCESNSNVETLESVPKPVESKSKVVSEPKVWSDAPIIEEYESDGDDEYVFKALVEQEKTSCAFINNVKHVKTPRKTIKDQDTCSQNPKVPKRDWTSLMSKRLGLGYCYTRKACFVCGSFSHLLRVCD